MEAWHEWQTGQDVTDLIYRAVQVLRENLYWIRISARDAGLMVMMMEFIPPGGAKPRGH